MITTFSNRRVKEKKNKPKPTKMEEQREKKIRVSVLPTTNERDQVCVCL